MTSRPEFPQNSLSSTHLRKAFAEPLLSSLESPIKLAFLWAAVNKIYPGWTPRTIKAKLSLVKDCAKARSELIALLGQAQHAALARELKERPELLGFVQWPYIHAGWLLAQRFEAFSQHQQALLTDMQALSFEPTSRVMVADLSSVSPGLRLIVDRASWFFREGSLVFNQFLDEERINSIAFSFGWRNGERVVYVGGVQGTKIDWSLPQYREIVTNLHRMRSRDFLIKSFQFLMHHLGVKHVLGIQNSQRHHLHAYFGADKIDDLHLNYDEIWLEHAGELTPNGFYRLPSLPIVRPIEEIASKSRGLYRKRYEMMDNLSEDIRSRFGKLPQTIESAP